MNKPVIPVLVFGSNVVTSTLSRVKEGNTNILNGFILTSEKKKDFRFLSENKLHCSDVRRHSKEDHEMHFIAQEKANKWFFFCQTEAWCASFKPKKCVECRDVQQCFTRKEVHSSVFYSLLTCSCQECMMCHLRRCANDSSI